MAGPVTVLTTLAAGLAVGGAAGACVALGYASPMIGVAVAAATGLTVGLRIRHLRRRIDGR
jgi:hypothetical protein